MTEYFAFMEVRYRRSSPLPGRGRNRQVTKAYPHRYIQLTKSKSWTGFEVSLNILYLPVFHFPLSGAPLFRSYVYIAVRRFIIPSFCCAYRNPP